MMLIDLWVLAILIELVLVLSAVLAFVLTRSRGDEDAADAALEAAIADLDAPHGDGERAPRARAKARRARPTAGEAPPLPDSTSAADDAIAEVSASTTSATHEAPVSIATTAHTPAPTSRPAEADAVALSDAERDGVTIDTSDLDVTAPPKPSAEPKTPLLVSMPPIAIELTVPSDARASGEDGDAAEEPPAPGADEIAAVEAEAVEAARPTPVFLDAEDIVALSNGAGDGMTEDDLMMLQDLVSSTEAKVKREAKSMQNLLDRLNGEAAALTGAAEEVNRTLEAEGIVEEVAVRLKKVAPALDSARSALSEVGPDLQDLQDTLRAIAGALASYQQSTAKEWHLNRPSADAINALIRAKAEKLSG